jgi:hypothetical protein
MHIPAVQNIQGSPLMAASATTIASNARLAETAAKLGAGQKGSGRRKKIRGGAPLNLNAHLPNLPEAGTISGVSAAGNHLKNVDNLNQIRAGAMYDKLGNAQPYDPAPTPTKGGRRTKRHRKTNGRRSNRTHRRRNRKSSNHSRRSRSSLLKSMAKRK